MAVSSSCSFWLADNISDVTSGTDGSVWGFVKNVVGRLQFVKNPILQADGSAAVSGINSIKWADYATWLSQPEGARSMVLEAFLEGWLYYQLWWYWHGEWLSILCKELEHGSLTSCFLCWHQSRNHRILPTNQWEVLSDDTLEGIFWQHSLQWCWRIRQVHKVPDFEFKCFGTSSASPSEYRPCGTPSESSTSVSRPCGIPSESSICECGSYGIPC